MSLTPGTRLGPYEVLSSLGAGGMGEVYRARDTRLGRDVAIKVLPQHLSGTPELRARFEREARSVSQLNHPNICTIHEVGEDRDCTFIVMEHVEGSPLSDLMAAGPTPSAKALQLALQIASAVAHAHERGASFTAT